MEKTNKLRLKKTNKKEEIVATICKETKDSNELESFELDVVTNLVSHKVESFSDTDIYTD